jgi:hypothetical protein
MSCARPPRVSEAGELLTMAGKFLGIGEDGFFGGADGPNAAAVFRFYALIVGLLFGIVLGLDATFRAARQRLVGRLR